MKDFYMLLYLLIGSLFYLFFKYNMNPNNIKLPQYVVMFLLIFLYPIFITIFISRNLVRLLRKKSHLVSIFFSSLLQIFFVSVNTILISKEMIIQAGVCGFLLSLVWTFNIRRIGLASWGERISYCLGAGLGTSGGILFIKGIREII